MPSSAARCQRLLNIVTDYAALMIDDLLRHIIDTAGTLTLMIR